MSVIDRMNKRARPKANTGFGANAQDYGGRFMNKDGNANVRKTGLPFFDRFSWFHTLLSMPFWKFIGVIVSFYFLINIVFALLYVNNGISTLTGIDPGDPIHNFEQAFFFSIQTFTTVGYGHISPSGFMASFIASVEALIGLLSFALATGLFYGRFSKPKAYLLFSENAVVAPYKNGRALMLRLCPYKNVVLTDVEARITLGLLMEEDGKPMNKFYTLELELEKISLLTLSWTLVHPITEDSPLFSFKKEEFEHMKGEMIVFVKAFDDSFSNNVVKRTSYTFKEIIYGARFVTMFTRNKDSTHTILHIDQLNKMEHVALPEV